MNDSKCTPTGLPARPKMWAGRAPWTNLSQPWAPSLMGGVPIWSGMVGGCCWSRGGMGPKEGLKGEADRLTRRHSMNEET